MERLRCGVSSIQYKTSIGDDYARLLVQTNRQTNCRQGGPDTASRGIRKYRRVLFAIGKREKKLGAGVVGSKLWMA